MIAFVLLAAAAASQPTQEQDLRCIAAVSAVIGQAEESKRAAVVPLLTYYVGRVSGRDPSIDLEKEIRRVYADKANFLDVFQAEIKRCSTEMEGVGRDLQRIGGAIKSNPDAPVK